MTAPAGSPWIVLTLSGELDISRTEELDEMAASAVSHQGINVIVDLSAVTFMDSSALRWLLRLQDRIGEVQGRLRVIAPSGGSLVRLLSLTGLEDRFAVFPTRTAAEEEPSGFSNAVDGLLAILSAPDRANLAMLQDSYTGDVWEQATTAGYTEWTGLGHRLTDKGRARSNTIAHGSTHQ